MSPTISDDGFGQRLLAVTQTAIWAVWFSMTLSVQEHSVIHAKESIESLKPDCGVLAVEMVFQAFGIDFRQEPAFANLCRQAPLSLRDLETTFCDQGLQTKSFRLDAAPETWIERTNQGSCLAIILVPTQKDFVVSNDIPGHYCVLLRWKNGIIEWLDPTTGTKDQLDTRLYPEVGQASFIQFIERPSRLGIIPPIGWPHFVLLGSGLFAICGYGWMSKRREQHLAAKFKHKEI